MKRSLRLLGIVLVVCLSLASAAARGQNLVTDPHFDDLTLAQWPDTYGGTVAWSALHDTTGTAGSGTVSITNTVGATFNVVGPANLPCVPLTPGLTYNIGGKAWIPSGQTATGDAEVNVNYYTDGACTTNQGTFAGASSAGPFDTPIVIAGSVVVPANANSGHVFVGALKNEATGSFQVFIDDAYFGIGIVPVTLMSFGAE